MTNLVLQNNRLLVQGAGLLVSGGDKSCCCEDCCSKPGIADPKPLTFVPKTENVPLGQIPLSITGYEGCVDTTAQANVILIQGAEQYRPCDPNSGAPVQSVDITNPGSGYARMGRISPLSEGIQLLTGLSGVGADIGIEIGSLDREPPISLAVSESGSATYSITGYTSSFYEYNNIDYGQAWRIISIGVIDSGNNYYEGQTITFTISSTNPNDNILDAPFFVPPLTGKAAVIHEEPKNYIINIGNNIIGAGAQLSVVWQEAPYEDWPAPHKKTYKISDIIINNGGSGYTQYEQIYLSFSVLQDGEILESAYIDIDSVDINGSITSIFISPNDGNYIPGPAGLYKGSETDSLHSVIDLSSPFWRAYYANTGGYDNCGLPFWKIKDISLIDGGSGYPSSGNILFSSDNINAITSQLGLATFQAPSGVITSIQLIDGGEFYKEDPTIQPYVFTPSATIENNIGNGAQFLPIVDTDTSSATFGQITDIVVSQSGNGYVSPSICELPESIYVTWNGVTIEVPTGGGASQSQYTIYNSPETDELWNIFNPPSGICNQAIPIDLNTTGNTFAEARMFVSISPEYNPYCGCFNKIYVNITYYVVCATCYPELNNFEPMYDINSWYNGVRLVKDGSKSLCFRFDVDNNGCPLSDAEYIGQLPINIDMVSANNTPASFDDGCDPYNYIKTTGPFAPCASGDPNTPGYNQACIPSGILNAEPPECPCDMSLSTITELPTISFMPP